MLGKYLSDTKMSEAIECLLWPLVFQNKYQNIFKRSSFDMYLKIQDEDGQSLAGDATF
jgi:hypothetical protein